MFSTKVIGLITFFLVLSFLAMFTQGSVSGAIVQLTGTSGCISEDGTGGECADGKALIGASSITTPDESSGHQVYVASPGSNAIAVFDRGNNNDVLTGTLEQIPGINGCISEDGSGGECADGKALVGVSFVVASHDGRNIYAASPGSNAIAAFARERGVSGILTQLPGSKGCVNEDGSGGECADGKSLSGASSVAISRDGKNVYVASSGSNAVAVFARSKSSGAIMQLSGTDGCISEDGSGGECADGKALVGANSVAISQDGRNVYVASRGSNAIAVFARDSKTGVLTQLPGTEGCVSEDSSGGECTDGKALLGVNFVDVSRDGNNLYVASPESNAIAAFARNRETGVLTQLPSTKGCISEDGTGGECADGKALNSVNFVFISTRDGAHIYTASPSISAMAVFSRNRKTGVLTQLSGAKGCVSEDGSGGECTDARALNGVSSAVTSPHGHNVYVVSQFSNALAIFERPE